MKYNCQTIDSHILNWSSNIHNTTEKVMATGSNDDSNEEENVVDDLDKILKCVSKTSKSELLDSIKHLLQRCTGVPVSELIPLLIPTCPYAAEELSPESTFLHETLMELLCAKMLNLETWFIDENNAELYLLSYVNLNNEDLVKPCKNFTKQCLTEFLSIDCDSESYHLPVCIFHNSITIKHFDFALKKYFQPGNPYDLLMESMQAAYPRRTSNSSILGATSDNPSCNTTVEDLLSSSPCQSNNEPPLLPTLAPDVLCAVYTDSKWYRGQIQGLDRRGVVVDLIDFEGSLTVSLPTKLLHVLSTEFTKLPPRKCRAKFRLDEMSSEEATDSRVLLALHQDWCLYSPTSMPNNNPPHKFLASIEVPCRDSSNNNLFRDSKFETQTLVFFPLSVESSCKKINLVPKS